MFYRVRSGRGVVGYEGEVMTQTSGFGAGLKADRDAFVSLHCRFSCRFGAGEMWKTPRKHKGTAPTG